MDSRMYPQGSGGLKSTYVGDTLVEPGVPRTLRTRKTLAEVAAGVTLLPAIPGYGYRITDLKMIAIGGTTAAGTSVDVKGTYAAGAVIIMSGLIAGLARSVLLRIGAATNGVILADGASFLRMDLNTPITVIAVGTFSGNTHWDFIVDYVVE